MLNLYKNKDYHWALFLGHLVLEKLLKAYYVKTIDINPPFLHDLLRLAEKVNLILSEEQKDFLDLATTFNINSRYPDYKKAFYKKCTKKFTKENIEKIRKFKLWLKAQIKK
ncbi:MAG: HEPN domain-containing protein [Armatimonadetes bacterium]|nr:HEPN domain-containing protein [Armatimonadota bacterium]